MFAPFQALRRSAVRSEGEDDAEDDAEGATQLEAQRRRKVRRVQSVRSQVPADQKWRLGDAFDKVPRRRRMDRAQESAIVRQGGVKVKPTKREATSTSRSAVTARVKLAKDRLLLDFVKVT